MAKKFLIRHLGNMGDFVFLILPVLASLKKHYPDCHNTVVTAWGFKKPARRVNKRPAPFTGVWGERDQGGFCLSLGLHNPNIDQLIHFHDTTLSLDASICCEGEQCFPTWNMAYYEQQKNSGNYDGVFELDKGVPHDENPLLSLYRLVGLPEETHGYYHLPLTPNERSIAAEVLRDYPRPLIFLLEGLMGMTTRGWDPGKISELINAIKRDYGVTPVWFGARYIPDYHGRPLTLRENIALLSLGSVGVGVMSGTLHFAAAVGLSTIALYSDQAVERAAPAYFLNSSIADPKKRHRTLLGPSPKPYHFLKSDQPPTSLTPRERANQRWRSWVEPGRQSTKSGLAVITVDEVMMVLHDMLPV